LERLGRPALAEFIGTFALTFFGSGSIIADRLLLGSHGTFSSPDLALIAAAHAVVLGVMVSALGHISGGHFNPAVTLGALIGRHVDLARAGVHWAAQFVGAIVAAGLLLYVFPAAATGATADGSPTLGAGFGNVHGFVMEAVLTFFLVLVVYATAIDPRGAFKSIAGFGIGLVLFFDILTGGPVTGASMNPARAFGPVLVSGTLSAAHFLIYWAGPVAGALVAAVVYQYLFMARTAARGAAPSPAKR
jgi:aquaporin Z